VRASSISSTASIPASLDRSRIIVHLPERRVAIALAGIYRRYVQSGSLPQTSRNCIEPSLNYFSQAGGNVRVWTHLHRSKAYVICGTVVAHGPMVVGSTARITFELTCFDGEYSLRFELLRSAL
jgi:hypothetical protein